MSQFVHQIRTPKGVITGLSAHAVAAILHEDINGGLLDEQRPESEPFRQHVDSDELWEVNMAVGTMIFEQAEQGSHSAFLSGDYLSISFGYTSPEEIVATYTFSKTTEDAPEQTAQAADPVADAPPAPTPAPTPEATEQSADPADGQPKQEATEGQGGEFSGAGASGDFQAAQEATDKPAADVATESAPAPSPAPSDSGSSDTGGSSGE